MTNKLVFSAAGLLDFGRRLLVASGVEEAKATTVAEALIAGNLRGVDSHGIALLPHYLEQLRAGDLEPNAEGSIVSESGGCMLYDAGHGFGHVTAAICCGHAVRLAREHGIAIVTAREANHFGAAAIWTRRISSEGAIGIAMCDAGPHVAPWQGREPRIGTNPLSVSVPDRSGRGWLLDMATTTVALGKIEQYKWKGAREMPAGWAMDSQGTPTTDVDAGLHGLLMPLGGYKGSGLGLMVEILAAVLSGGAMAREIRGIRMHGSYSRVNHTFIAIEVSRFLPLEEFYARMDRLIAEIKSCAPAAGYAEVLVAGEPEWRFEEARRESGIPLSDGAWEGLVAAAQRLGVELPVPDDGC
jgi:LDH2 family malate/lactate/ureidoglycolate dehydrogenase